MTFATIHTPPQILNSQLKFCFFPPQFLLKPNIKRGYLTSPPPPSRGTNTHVHGLFRFKFRIDYIGVIN